MKQSFGLIGFPVKHSLSKLLYQVAFTALKLSAKYNLWEIKPADLGNFIAQVKKQNIAGLSVTIPHKITVMKFLDEIETEAKSIGAVNTIINDRGRLKGANTDCDGAIQAILETINSLKNKLVVIFGAGGAARAITYGLHKQGAKVVILNRHWAKAQKLAKKYEFTADVIANCYRYPADILIQTTPVGTTPNINQTIVPSDYLKPKMIVFDIVYQPKMTKLLQEAKAKGCTIITGDKMLLYQAVRQFELLTKKKALIKVMRQALIKHLE